MTFKLFVKSRKLKAGGVVSVRVNEMKFSVVDARCANERRGENSVTEAIGGRSTFGGGYRRPRRDLIKRRGEYDSARI